VRVRDWEGKSHCSPSIEIDAFLKSPEMGTSGNDDFSARITAVQLNIGGVVRPDLFLAARAEGLRRRELPLCPGTGGAGQNIDEIHPVHNPHSVLSL